jgi:hypothetical protein
MADRAGRRAALAAALAAWLLAGAAGAVSLEDVLPLPPREAFRLSARDVLARAFDNLYGCDLQQRADLVTRTRAGVVRRQVVHMLRKRIGGRAHSLLDYRTTNELYGLRLLKIEGNGRADDHFMWVPDLRRVRRFTSAQRGDQVQGSDLNLEDLEFRRAETFAIVGRRFDVLRGERVHRLTLEPLFDSAYARADLFVEPRDFAIREVHYYRRGSRRPYKRMTAPVDEMVRFDGRVLPGRWIIRDYERDTETDLSFTDIAVDPPLEDGMFSVTVLESGRPLPGVDY